MRIYLPFIILSLSLGLIAQAPFPLQQYGNGGCGTGDYVPTFHTGGEFPILGNSNFQVVSRNLRGGMPGFLLISPVAANLPLPGLTLLVDPVNTVGLLGIANGTSGIAGAGMATIPLSVPNDTSMLGGNLFLQSFYFDTLSPVSVVHTQGLQLNFRQSVSKNITALYDRVAYQKYVTNAATGLAVWNANKVTGFTYVNTQQFTCGGQTHWIVIVKDNTYNIEFMLIPGGSYQMGDLNNLGNSREKPVHWVHLEPFLLARTEVTQGQFQAVMGTTPWKGLSYVWTGANASAYAANYIDWNDSTAFCAKIGCRLPSESEWEYACRGGTTTAYHYGSNSSTNLGQYAWYYYNANYVYQRYPHQAGIKLPNAFGLRDMHGNVYEWCQDRWHNDYKGAPTNGLPWETGSLSFRVFRGGSWGGDALGCRSAIRFRYRPSYRNSGFGLRPARSLR